MQARFFTVLFLTACLFGIVRADSPETTAPDASLAPDAVVRIVVEALGDNATLGNDAGILTAWRFASPSNRAYTGPFDRFVSMVKGGFGNMLDHVTSRYSPVKVKGNVATQVVILETRTGDEYAYLFTLGRQNSGEFIGAWMTEAVQLIASNEVEGIRI